MHFLVDAQLPPALAKWLIGRGHVAAHVFKLGLERAADRSIWDRALEIGAVIVTKDEDSADSQSAEKTGRTSFGVRLGNTTRPKVLARFEHHLPAILDALERGNELVEICYKSRRRAASSILALGTT